MPSLCQNIKTSYEHLMKLTAEFVPKYVAAKESGDLEEVRLLRTYLEAARDTLLEYLPVFTVPNAKNPYHEALLRAGLEDEETEEQQEITIDILKEIEGQLAIYTETRDETGKPCLQEWVKDITQNKYLIYAKAATERAKIMERIEAGMMPIVMPGRSIQIKTWKVALAKLKPVWIENGIKRIVHDGDITNERMFHDDINKKYREEVIDRMTAVGYFRGIPDRPYIVWVHPTQAPSSNTMKKTFERQRTFYARLMKDYPNLFYHPTDLIPTEYIALQAIFTSYIQKEFSERTNGIDEPMDITPLDYFPSTCFLSAGTFSDGSVPCMHFTTQGQRVLIGHHNVEADPDGGFRPVSRT